MKPTLTVRITSPEDIIWQGKAYSVSSTNSAGPFDILPQHANFITITENIPVKVDSLEGPKKFTFPNVIIYNHNNVVNIYTI